MLVEFPMHTDTHAHTCMQKQGYLLTKMEIDKRCGCFKVADSHIRNVVVKPPSLPHFCSRFAVSISRVSLDCIWVLGTQSLTSPLISVPPTCVLTMQRPCSTQPHPLSVHFMVLSRSTSFSSNACFLLSSSDKQL